MSAYEKLHQHFRKLDHLRHVAAIAHWDEATMMPPGGGKARGRAMATLEVVIHDLLLEPWLPELIDTASRAELTQWQRANLREMAREVTAATSVPADLVKELFIATSKAEQAWRVARPANDWKTMVPLLSEVFRLTREKGLALGTAKDLSCYDALLDEYEPGASCEAVSSLFLELKAFLPDLVQDVIDKQSGETVLPARGPFSDERQHQLGKEVMTALGFDFYHGRLDVSHHPFCGGVHEDVRITTRYDAGDFVKSLMSVIHETGHALYEQGLPLEWTDQPVGKALSTATHESQSLMMEMQIARTPEFLAFAAPHLREALLGRDTDDPAWSAENLYRLCTRVSRGHIRVDADEVTYPLHVILRYEIERDLIEQRLGVSDLPDAWSQKMQEYLGIDTTEDYRNGCLQDVHWPAGLIGYFPTYTLGALAASQLCEAAVADCDGLLENVRHGDFDELLSWLRRNVHNKGRLMTLDELLLEATGAPMDAASFRNHLRRRYLET